jgi:hypothetical protein
VGDAATSAEPRQALTAEQRLELVDRLCGEGWRTTDLLPMGRLLNEHMLRRSRHR